MNAVARRLESAVEAHRPRGASVGVAAVDLKTQRQVFGHNPDALLILASNAKVFVTAAALAELGPGYEFKTSIIASGVVKDGVLDGDLVLRGGGDPNISGRFHDGDALAVPRSWAKAVVAASVRRITGDLVADDTFFDREWLAPGWPRDQLLWWYCAPVGALSFNDNCVDVLIRAGNAPGAAPTVQATPDIPAVRLITRATTVGSKETDGIDFRRAGDGLLAFEILGRIRVRRSRTENLTVVDPALYLAEVFAHTLREQGVGIVGKVRRIAEAEPQRPARTLYVFRSPLSESIVVAIKRSQNFYAEQILKTLGAEKAGGGSFEEGVRAVAQFHRRIGLDPGRVLLRDGCGLSRDDRAQASAVCHVLAWMARSEHGKMYRDSFAVSGQDGTLERRLDDSACKGRIQGKTGTIAGVSNLSGYASAADGGEYAFSVLVNRAGASRVGEAHGFQDAVCRAILGAPNRSEGRR
jgi:D-alanyl-D-alanine carboxypeptidase/D-alanyl-D-alanine-endopeptidase (penicillin-binding protein 4)